MSTTETPQGDQATDLRLDSDHWGNALGAGGSSGTSLLNCSPEHMTASQASAFVQNEGLAHRVVWAPPEDAIAPGWTVEGEPAQQRIVTLATLAGGASRARGGAYFWFVLPGEPKDDWGDPLPDGPHEDAVCHVLTADDLSPLTWDAEPGSPRWGHPVSYTLTPVRDEMAFPGVTVHHSRLAYVPGLRKWPGQRHVRSGRDLSVLDLYRPAIEDMRSGWDSLASLIRRRAMPWLKLALARAAATTDNGSAMRTRIAAIARGMVTRAMIILGKEDEVGWTAPPLTGTSETSQSQATRLSSVEGIPASRIMGTPPGGLSTDDQQGRRAYDAVQSRCRAAVEDALLRWYDVKWGEDEDRLIEWRDLNTPTAKELADTSLVLAQRDAALIVAGAIHADESRARFDNEEETPVPVLMDEPERGEDIILGDAPVVDDA